MSIAEQEPGEYTLLFYRLFVKNLCINILAVHSSRSERESQSLRNVEWYLGDQRVEGFGVDATEFLTNVLQWLVEGLEVLL